MTHLLNLGFVALRLAFVFLRLIIVIVHLLLRGRLFPNRDGIVDKFTMLLYQIFQSTLLEELELIFFQVQLDLGAAAQLISRRVTAHCEAATRSALPNILLVVVVFGQAKYGRSEPA